MLYAPRWFEQYHRLSVQKQQPAAALWQSLFLRNDPHL